MAFLWSGQLSQVRQSFQQWGGEWDGKSLFPLSGTVWYPPFTSLEKVVVVTAVCGLSVVRSTCPGIALDWGWRGRHWCVSRSGSKERSWSRGGGKREEGTSCLGSDRVLCLNRGSAVQIESEWSSMGQVEETRVSFPPPRRAICRCAAATKFEAGERHVMCRGPRCFWFRLKLRFQGTWSPVQIFPLMLHRFLDPGLLPELPFAVAL